MPTPRGPLQFLAAMLVATVAVMPSGRAQLPVRLTGTASGPRQSATLPFALPPARWLPDRSSPVVGPMRIPNDQASRASRSPSPDPSVFRMPVQAPPIELGLPLPAESAAATTLQAAATGRTDHSRAPLVELGAPILAPPIADQHRYRGNESAAAEYPMDNTVETGKLRAPGNRQPNATRTANLSTGTTAQTSSASKPDRVFWSLPAPIAPQHGVPSALASTSNSMTVNPRHAASGTYDSGNDGRKQSDAREPIFFPAPETPRAMDPSVRPVPYNGGDFSPNPLNPLPTDPLQELQTYRGKYEVPTQRPLIEWWRPLYATGILPAPRPVFGPTNLSKFHFYVYGDFRSGVGINDSNGDDRSVWAFRANLDMDLQITATERIHAFIGPLDRGGDFTRVELGRHPEFVNRTDLRLDNLFFEGDVGQIWGGLTGTYAPFDLPVAFGFLPLFYQNGIWAADNVIGAAISIPSRNSPALMWSNYDITFFWAADQVNSDAFPGDNNAAELFGTAWFIDAYDGYIEADYAYVRDDVIPDRSYHNISLAFTRRYWQRISNSIRVIVNAGQDLPKSQRTADGHLVLIENSLISRSPNTVVPYFNFFYGQGRPQSLARANGAGGVLNNTGINFETDGLTGYPTLDPTGVNTAGGAIGLNLLTSDFRQQLVLELAGLAALGSPQFRNAPGDQYAVGFRYQRALTNSWLFRTDHMYGWLDNAPDVRGSRFEFRWKF